MSRIFFFCLGMIPIVIFIAVVVIFIKSCGDEKKYTKEQTESGEDKRIFMKFAKSLFDQPERYQYLCGGYIKTESKGNHEYVYWYHSYVVAFNEEGELWICPFQCENHVPMLKNMMQIDFAETDISYHVDKKQSDLTIRMAGEHTVIWIEDVVKSSGEDNSQYPFAIEQSAERAKFNQVIPKFKELRKQKRG